MPIRQRFYNTLEVKTPLYYVEDEALFEGVKLSIVQDIPLSRQIVSDLEYGVGNRPTLPSCFDDDEDVRSGKVDYAVDLRYSQWDALSDVCNPVNLTPDKPQTVAKTESVEVTVETE